MGIFQTLLLALPLALAAPATTPNISPRSNSGSMTYYAVGLGACGITNSDAELVCAMSASLYDANKPCGKHIKITGPAGSVTVKVVDRCVGCAYHDLDLSPTAFQKAIGDLSVGRKTATWEWV